MNNKEEIMRNLEYLAGGMFVFKIMCGNKENNAPYYNLMEEWSDIIFNTMELIGEDYVECQKPLKSLPQ